MIKSATLRYDGNALQLAAPILVEVNERFDAEMEEVEPSAEGPTINSAFAGIIARAIEMDVDDLADQHDHYLYGLPKH